MDRRARPALIRAAAAWTPDGVLPDAAVLVGADGTILGVGPATPEDGPALPGLLVPGLINAHTHLELTGVPRVRGDGLADWVNALAAARAAGAVGDAGEGARQCVAYGIAAVCDHAAHGDTAAAIAAAGLRGVVQHELIGHDPAREAAALEVAAAGLRAERGLTVRPTAHGPHSTPAAVIRAVSALGAAPPASVHVAEHPDERAFLHGSGPFVDLLAWWGVDTSGFTPPLTSPVAYLEALGALGPGLLAVHAVDLDRADISRLARHGVSVVTCPRSNLHISRRLAELPSLLRVGVRVLLGTDSSASCPDVDVLAEIPILADAFPDVPVSTWLAGCTHAAADALGLPRLGRIERGAAPGLLLLEGIRDPADLAARIPTRRWLAAPGSAP